MIDYIPYTYLIGWTKINKYYYGCEYAKISKTANPKNLWETYFTSSNLVKQYREIYGEPDIVQVRKTFCCDLSTKYWEEKVLRRLKVLSNDKFLNENISGVNFGLQSKRFAGKKHTAESNLKNRNSQLGRKHTDETKRKISIGNTNKSLSQETKKKISEAHTGKKRDENFRKKRSELTKGKNNPRFDSTLYTFIHPIHGEITCTKYILKNEYGATNITKVINNHPKYSHSNGWKLKRSL
jgi:hypothetical protein